MNVKCRIIGILISVLILFSHCKNYEKVNYILADWQQKISNKEIKDIYDYYLLLPDKYIDCETVQKIDELTRKSKIKLLDQKNGYIEFDGFGRYMALFKNKTDNKDIIVITSGDSGRGSNCGGLNVVLEFDWKNHQWIYRYDLLPSEKETKQYVEKYKNNTDDIYPCCYVLPRFGTIVKFIDEAEKIIYNMYWNGERFIIKK